MPVLFPDDAGVVSDEDIDPAPWHVAPAKTRVRFAPRNELRPAARAAAIPFIASPSFVLRQRKGIGSVPRFSTIMKPLE
jgi:hypothetical protein